MLLSYYYLVTIVKVLSLQTKGKKAMMGYRSHSEPYCTLRTGWMEEYEKDILQKSKLYLVYVEVDATLAYQTSQ